MTAEILAPDELEGVVASSTGSSRAPEEWKEIPEIKARRPMKPGFEISLQRVDGTDVCVWMKGWGGVWKPASEYFRVTAR